MKLFSRRNRKTGGALIELAIAGPVLVLMGVGSVDFARAFYQSTTISNAAESGAWVGTRNIVWSAHYTDMQNAATQDAQDVGSVTVTATRECRCPPSTGNPTGATVDCLTGSCTGYGSPRVYVRCQVQKNFRLVAPMPKIPNLFTVRREVFLRVQ